MNLSKIRWLWHQESVVTAQPAERSVINRHIQEPFVPTVRARPGTIRVLIVAGEPLVRQRLVERLAPSSAFEIAAGASAEEGYWLAEQREPDVAVVGAALVDAPGLTVVAELRHRVPGLAVIVVAAQETDEELFAAIRAGAAAYCGQEIGPAELMALVRRTSAGEYVINGQLPSPPYGRPGPMPMPPLFPSLMKESPYRALTDREADIAAKLRDGMTDQEIGAALGIGPQTVRNHVASITRKLGRRDRNQAVRRGWLAAAKVPPR